MNFQVSFKVNPNIYIRDPEASELGRMIVNKSIDQICKLGFEHFTFKKLATEAGTTEASIYRYFENKHKLLLYILNWYWSYMEYLVVLKIQNIPNPKIKLKTIIHLLTHDLPEMDGQMNYNKKFLNQIVISESSKAYLVKEVKEINKSEVFKPYKELCAKISEVILFYNPKYKFPLSLASTMIETAHHQQFFSVFLPKLTDVSPKKSLDYTSQFLEDFTFKILG